MLPKPTGQDGSTNCQGCPLFEPPFGKKVGFSKPDGDGSSGVAVIGEALGEDEERHGVGFVGKSGHYLFNNLARVGVSRDTLTIFNVVACRPPDNKLVGMSYERACIDHCRPNLDGVIENARSIAQTNGKTFTIVTLGKTAFKRVLNIDDKSPILKEDYLAYPFWSDTYQAWVLAADHPSYTMRGNHHLAPITQFVFKRALEIANEGLTPRKPVYLLDPDPMTFHRWVDDFLVALTANPQLVLSYDIETPYKQGADEEDAAKENSSDYTILRCAFAYRPNEGVSVPWRAEYMADLQRLFQHSGYALGWNSLQYDLPRIKAQFDVTCPQIDGLLGWHVLNSALPKSLGFVAPFYIPNISLWKHLSSTSPAEYNCIDADAALQIWNGVHDDLLTNNLWQVFNRHVMQVSEVFTYMTKKGVKVDLTKRKEAEDRVAAILVDLQQKIEAVIPFEARELKVYLKAPSDLSGLVEVDGQRKTTKCPLCSTLDIKAAHYKSIGKKRLKLGEVENPCFGAKSLKVIIPAKQWALPLPFKLSKLSLLRYQKARKHKPIVDWKTKKITFDEKAISRLMKLYSLDPLYPLITDFREAQKLLGAYIGVTDPITGKVNGGIPVGKDGRVHGTYTHNPSTLRSAMQSPSLQVLPRPQGKDDIATLIRGFFVPENGYSLAAADFAGIESVLTGYFAVSPTYIRLAKSDVHSFYTSYALNAQGKFPANDLPLLSWDDDKLFAHLASIKREYKSERNNLYKHLTHALQFGQKPKGAADTILRTTGKEVSIAVIGRAMAVFHELFPEISRWHRTLLEQVDKDGFLRNPYGYVHRFSRAYEWENVYGQWQKSPGPDANKIFAFLPQSTASGIIKEAMLRIWEHHYEAVGQYLRLLIHDELLGEPPDHQVEEFLRILKMEMEQPIQQMRLPSNWGMGDYLTILTESKQGKSWSTMS